MLANQVYDSKFEVADPVPPSVLVVHGEYTVHPMQTCSEEEVAVLFTKVSQRNNPVLQGRPFEDLKLLGRAMYRKSCKLGMGQVAKHNGKVVGLGCAWDAADGGVWANSGLEMPDSLRVHSACGKACFDALPKRDGKVLFGAFVGILPKYSAHCFSIIVCSTFAVGRKMGFEYTFQFTLLPNLQKRAGIFTDIGAPADESLNWAVKFTDIVSERAEVLEELQELGGVINCNLNRYSYNESDEYMQLAATMVRMETGDELRRLVDVAADNHFKWLQSFAFEWSHCLAFGNPRLTSKL